MWLVLALATFAAVPALAQDTPRNVVLFGWDGAQREHVMQCLEKGELPTLKQLAAEGKLVNIDVRGTTDTKAGWTQILTGYDPEVTGVYSNGRFQAVPKGLSVFERLKEHFGPNFICCAVIGKSGHCGEINPPVKEKISDKEAADLEAQIKGERKKHRDKDDNQEAEAGSKKRQAKKRLIGWKVVEENGVKYKVFPGSPYYIMKDACAQWLFGLSLDSVVGPKAMELMEQYKNKPFFFFVHFAEVDHKGHARGENSKEYNDALISNDTWTGKIIQKLKDLGLYDKTTVYVTADHGFNEGKTGHGNAPYVFLATNDRKVCRDGDRADITPTIYDSFGIDASKFSPPLAGHSLRKPLKDK
jgi:hypothetical protein